MILVIGPLPPPVNGASSMTLDVLRLLENEGLQVRAFTTSPSAHGGVAGYHLSRICRYLRACWNVAISPKPLTVYLSLAGGWGQIYDLLVAIVARLRGLTIHFHHHNFTYSDWRFRLFAMIVAVAGERQVHHVLCERMGALLAERYPRIRNVRVVSNEAFWPPPSPVELRDRPLRRIGFIANITRNKGIFGFLDIVAALRARGSNVEALIAGPVTECSIEPELRRRAEELSDVRIQGPVYGADRDRFFDEIDMLVFPTAYPNEAEPLVILEAQRRGIPVAASNRGCIAAIIDPADGMLLGRDGGEYGELVETIIRLSQDVGQMQARRRSVMLAVEARATRNAPAREAFLRSIREEV
ncbi:glycosyltransferase family 4 protein [Aminobacter sp. J44]|uniref:glycosyltransferase family 4 protein n=1 Tax=Aminobacter sp. J44 TaxID=935262 RepID=UPI00119AA311|nr:glycosyltransferase family 4 protein [Aminobacter sp. J44]TWG53700.1 glycosyltransferase involved in cell wall biosynthesis [Aminobacter sp. J44]